MKQLLRIAIITLTGIYISYQIITGLDHEGLFDKEKNTFYEVIACITFFIILCLDTRQFIKTKKRYAFAATVTGFLIFVGHFIVLRQFKQRDKSPSQLYCVTKMNDFNGVSIDFRKDGTYKLTSWCLGADIYRGKFTIKDSIISIDESHIENSIVSNRFVIRRDGEKDSAGKREKSIYQIDKRGQVINRSSEFRVVEDYVSSTQ